MKGYYALNAAWCERCVPAGIPKDEIIGSPKTPPVCAACHVQLTPLRGPLCAACGRRQAILMSHDAPLNSNVPNRCEECELAA